MSAWTDAEKRELSGYLRAGMSAGQIAKLMPDRTRNSIIGLIHRDRDLGAIGLKGPGRWAGYRKADAKAGSPISIAENRRKNVRGGVPKKTISEPRSGEVIPMKPRPKPTPRPVQPDYAEASAYDAAALVVGALPVSNAHCKWPIGDPKAEGFGFCGHLRLGGKPYCQHHKDRATRVVFRGEAAA